MTKSIEAIDPPSVLLALTSEEKLQLLSGSDMWHTAAVPRLGIPRVRVSLPACFVERVELTMADERRACEYALIMLKLMSERR